MRILLTLIAIAAIYSTASGQEAPVVGAFEQRALESAWRQTGTPFPEGLVFYRLPRASQMLVVMDGREHRGWYADSYDLGREPNGNRKTPWTAPGGLEGVDGWQSHLAIALPGNVEHWVENVDVPNAGRKLPRLSWEFPSGTVTADLLTNAAGEPFEIRTRTKTPTGWQSKIAWADHAKRPAGYQGVGQSCSSCHDKAGTSEVYGITVRGCDTVFSWHPVRPESISRFQVAPLPRLNLFWPLREKR